MNFTTFRFLVLGVLALGHAFAAEWNPGKYMSQAIGKIVGAGTMLEQRYGYGWNSTNVCLLGAYLQPGGNVDLNIWLNEGTQYAFVAAGSDSAEDVDLEIWSSGVRLRYDTKVDPTPVVEFQPARSGNYTMRLKLYRGAASFSAVAILQKGGFRVPIGNLADAYMRNIRLANGAADRMNGVRFHEYNNQWALFGQVLRPSERLSIDNMTFESGGRHILVATGDDNASDLDLTVTRDGVTVAQDNDADATPVAFVSSSGPGHSMTARNAASSGPTLVIVSVLDRQ